MADKKVSDLPSLNGADVDAADLLYIVDSSAGAAGSKKITVGQYQLAPVSGGTANTVVYLNGSKVESSSSALTFDGTNLGIGTSSPGAKLDVASTSAGATAEVLRLSNPGAGANTQAQLKFFTTSTNYGTISGGYGASAPQMTFDLPNVTAGNYVWQISSSEKMRLDSSGNLGLGVTPSAWLGGGYIDFPGNGYVGNATGYSSNTLSTGLNAYYATGAWRYKASSLAATRFDHTNGTFAWYTAPSGTAGNAISFTQAMTLTSGGDLLVGTATVSGAGGLTYLNQGSTGFASINNNNAGATGYVFSSYRRSSVEIGSITQNGTTAVLFNTTSDRRLKDNIAPAPSASDVIDAIEIVSHDWKSAPDEHVTYGVIAQDLALVAPQAVLQGDDGDEIEKTWGVDYSKLVPMLIKEIQSLRARVAALEAK